MSTHFGKLNLLFIPQCQLCLPKYKKQDETKSSILEPSPQGLIFNIYYIARLVTLAILGDSRVLLEIQNLYLQFVIVKVRNPLPFLLLHVLPRLSESQDL